MRSLGEWTPGIRLLVGLSLGFLQPLVQGVPPLKEKFESGIYVQKGQLFESTDCVLLAVQFFLPQTRAWLRMEWAKRDTEKYALSGVDLTLVELT